MTDLVEAMARGIFEKSREYAASREGYYGPDKTWDEITNDEREFAFMIARAQLTAIEASGYRVVPVEMTEEQYEALSATGKMWRELNSREVYRVLLAAAPKVTP